SLREENRFLRQERDVYRRDWYFASRRIGVLRERVDKLAAENGRLRRRVKELTAGASSEGHAGASAPPPFVKPSSRGRRKRPGRKKGHPAALRPVPTRVDVHRDVPLPRDASRLPFAQVVRVLADLPGLTVSAGGISRQLQRLGEWLDPYYERVKLALRAAPRVNGDETGWRADGRNGYLWAVTGPRHTLYHVDK